MNKYLLDTNICVFYFRENKNIRVKIEEIGIENCYVSEITIAELLYGAEKSQRPKHFDEVDKVLQSMDVICVFDTLSVYSKLRVYLEKFGKPIDGFDLLIAAAAIANDMILVTDNTRHFARIPGLKFENWLE